MSSRFLHQLRTPQSCDKVLDMSKTIKDAPYKIWVKSLPTTHPVEYHDHLCETIKDHPLTKQGRWKTTTIDTGETEYKKSPYAVLLDEDTGEKFGTYLSPDHSGGQLAHYYLYGGKVNPRDARGWDYDHQAHPNVSVVRYTLGKHHPVPITRTEKVWVPYEFHPCDIDSNDLRNQKCHRRYEGHVPLRGKWGCSCSWCAPKMSKGPKRSKVRDELRKAARDWGYDDNGDIIVDISPDIN